jgi:hypothetical protein
MAMMRILDDDELPLGRGCRAEPGPAIVTRAEAGGVWGGTSEELGQIENSEDLASLVVFDTWTRNCDRFPPDLATRKPNYDNVFLSTESIGSGRSVLKAIDHNNAFVCGRDLDVSVKHIAKTKDARVYGFFPAFASYVTQTAVNDALVRLANATAAKLRPFVDSLPAEWDVPANTRAALVEFLSDRAGFLVESGIALPAIPDAGDEQPWLFPGG